MKTKDCVVEAIDLMPVKDMWLTVASVALLAAWIRCPQFSSAMVGPHPRTC
jgi:hypothetical protein